MVKVLILSGGLGNQMFQYAMVLALRKRGVVVSMDTSMYGYLSMHNGYELERVFGITETVTNRQGLHIYWLRLLNKYKPHWLCIADTNLYDESVFKVNSNYLIGYWQDERYFKNVEKEIRHSFVFQNIDEKNLKLAVEMTSCNSVSIHIRRGDYASSNMTLLSDGYYEKAVSYMKRKVQSPVYYIFSDDKNEAKRIADQCGISYRLIDHNNGDNSYKDMYLMSQCKHNIIANSSFSWWGAWLNSNVEKIIVAPMVWIERRPEIKPQCEDWFLI